MNKINKQKGAGDLVLIIIVIIVLFFLWLYTGGSNRKESNTTPFFRTSDVSPIPNQATQ